ncbi:MAG: hypothetical protein GY730_04715 [bacterium]|uniref:hypothetical protein n=1 Tax=Pseudoalteromonas sp. bablab_jr010 TaxID=2755063 RepID=UPI0018F41B41|nr:hypothetical protein [Pseudoalteromonas sp. bablab_jr010]MCP4049989.1 hypothetical protein [bacterium]
MESFKAWFIRVTISYLVLFLALFMFYVFCVKGGSWGSFSDVVIAVFTILIAYTTNLILIAAWLASNDWNKEKKYELGLSLLSNLVSFYALCWELRILKVRSFDEYKLILQEGQEMGACAQCQDDSAINKCIEQVKEQTEKSIENLAVINIKIKELEGRIEKLHGSCLLEASLYESAIVEKVDIFVKESSSIKISNEEASLHFNKIAEIVLHSSRSLPNLPADDEILKLLNKYKSYSDLNEIKEKFSDEY